MKHPLFLLCIFPLTVSVAAADPFAVTSANGSGTYSVWAQTTHSTSGSPGSAGASDVTGFYMDAGSYAEQIENWDYTYDQFGGYDLYGNEIWTTIHENQYEEARAEAHVSAEYYRGENQIDTRVFASAQANNSASGSMAFAYADASASAHLDLTFLLATSTTVELSSFSGSGGGFSLYRGVDLVMDSFTLTSLGGLIQTTLPAGAYSLVGDASGGDANFHIYAVPEPASLAALGLGLAVALRRKRR
jgi:hypothetical protein